jgi:hypothetical protein
LSVHPHGQPVVEPNLFSDNDNTVESEEALARLGAFVAPVASNRGAVIEDAACSPLLKPSTRHFLAISTKPVKV